MQSRNYIIDINIGLQKKNNKNFVWIKKTPTFVMQKAPLRTERFYKPSVTKGEKGIRCESVTIPVAVSSILVRRIYLWYSLPLTEGPLGRHHKWNKSENLPFANGLKPAGLRGRIRTIFSQN